MHHCILSTQAVAIKMYMYIKESSNASTCIDTVWLSRSFILSFFRAVHNLLDMIILNSRDAANQRAAVLYHEKRLNSIFFYPLTLCKKSLTHSKKFTPFRFRRKSKRARKYGSQGTPTVTISSTKSILLRYNKCRSVKRDEAIETNLIM